MTQTLVKFPSRGRPRLFASQFERWQTDPSVTFLVTLDADDPSLPAYQDFLYGRSNVTVRVGNSRGKVEAINDGVAEHPWDGMMILASDDFAPTREDYASYLRGHLFERFPDGDGVMQVPDGRRNDGLNTVPIMGRRYFERFGYVYSPAYVSVFCDDEYTEVSKRLGRVFFLDEVVLRHDWIGEHAPDALHKRNESYYAEDGATFERRRRWGFPA